MPAGIPRDRNARAGYLRFTSDLNFMLLDKTVLERVNTFQHIEYPLEAIQLFRNISDNNLGVIRHLIQDCDIVRARAGQTVLDASSAGSRLYIVLSGALGVTMLNDDGNHLENTITQYLPGECVGEISVLDEKSILQPCLRFMTVCCW
jgi:CRP-like cAMP-binding protein